MNDPTTPQAKIDAALAGGLISIPIWSEFFNGIGAAAVIVAQICGAIVGVWTVYRIIRGKGPPPLVALATLIATSLILAATAAQAQQRPCAPVQAMQDNLASEYGGMPAFIAAAGEAGDLAVATFINPKTNSFSILVVRPDGIACMIAAGEHWRGLPAKPVGEAS